jgi:outer membrane protein OmpA-like peptidoglycan-associated protein
MNKHSAALALALVVLASAAPARAHGRKVNFNIDLGGAVPLPGSGLKETTFKQYPWWADACNATDDPAYGDGPGYNGYIATCNPAAGGFDWGITLDINTPVNLGLGSGYKMAIFARTEDPLYRPDEGGGSNKADKTAYIAHFIRAFFLKLRLLDFAGKKYERKWGSLDLDLDVLDITYLYGGSWYLGTSQTLSYMFAVGDTFQIGMYVSMVEAFTLDKRPSTTNGMSWDVDGRTGAIDLNVWEGNLNEMWLSFGMRMALGFADWGKKKKAAPEDEFGGVESDYAEQMKLMDQDGDGLSDYAEMMLGTDATKRDSDGDTVPDGIEDANNNGIRDPGETHPAMYDSDMGGANDGWEIANGYDPNNPDDDDRDLDGVVDDVDLCPGSQQGAEVGTTGCPTLTEAVVLDEVTFVEDTAELNPEAYNQLDQYAMILMQDPDLEVVILVFGPPKGNAKKIKKTTEDQATAIKDYLILRGLAEERIVVSGEGKSPDGPKVELQPIIPLF